MKFIDWFAGIGGFRRGMELQGHKCVGFCEFDKYAVMSYTAMHLCTQEQLDYLATLPLKQRQKEILKEEYRNGEWYANDVRTVDARNIPEADCWCFGFPCQDISVAGKQLGFTGNRSSLFFRVMYMVGQLEEEKKPTYLFIENVKNLLSVNGGWDFARLLIEMDKNGYDAEWDVLNSKYFGVPQNRERCFIIGHLRGRGGSEVFPVEGADRENNIHGIAHRNGYRRNTQVFAPDGITEALDTAQGGGRGHYTIEVIGKTRESKVVDRTRIISIEGIGSCLRSTGHKDPTKVAIPVLTPDQANKRQNGRRFKEDGEESFTVTAQDRHGVAVAVDDMYQSRDPRFYDQEAPALRSERAGLKAMVDVPTPNDQVQIGVTGYNTTSNQGGGVDRNGTDSDGERLQGPRKSDDDGGSGMFAIDKGFRPEERTEANCLTTREDRGLSRHKQEGTLICKILEYCEASDQNTESKSEKNMKAEFCE